MMGMMMHSSKAAIVLVASNLPPSSLFITPQAPFVSLRPPDDRRELILGFRLSNCLIVPAGPVDSRAQQY